MFSWGRCDNGQLGLGGIQDEEISVPRNVQELPNDLILHDVKAGESHTLILSSEGKIFTCGSNEHGQVKLGSILKNWKMIMMFSFLTGPKSILNICVNVIPISYIHVR